MKTKEGNGRLIDKMSKAEKERLIPHGGTFLTLMNYKEPLKPLGPAGHGFYGCLLSTVDGEFVQCHVCGELFKDVGRHSAAAHNLYAKDYRKEFDLAYGTALCSENERERRKKKFLSWLNGLSAKERAEYDRKVEAGRRRSRLSPGTTRGYTIRGETRNLRGTCPDQLLDKIKKVTDKLGHTPSKHEFIGECETQRHIHLIYKTFGSWQKALQMLGMRSRTPASNNGKYRRYTDKELLEYLALFAKRFNKVPTATDFRRGLLPSYGIYVHRFGGIENARQEAGVYNYLTK